MMNGAVRRSINDILAVLKIYEKDPGFKVALEDLVTAMDATQLMKDDAAQLMKEAQQKTNEANELTVSAQATSLSALTDRENSKQSVKKALDDLVLRENNLKMNVANLAEKTRRFDIAVANHNIVIAENKESCEITRRSLDAEITRLKNKEVELHDKEQNIKEKEEKMAKIASLIESSQD